MHCTSCKGQLYNLGCPTCTPRVQTRTHLEAQGEGDKENSYNDVDESECGLESLLSHRTLLSSVVHPCTKQSLALPTNRFPTASSMVPLHSLQPGKHTKSPLLVNEPVADEPKPLVYFKTGSMLNFGPAATPCGCTSRVKVGLVNRGYRDLQVELSLPDLPFVLLHENITLKQGRSSTCP